jgi:sugar lactone lactonase YvrE
MRDFVAIPCTTDLYELGECCRWDEIRGELSWVDVYAGRFFRASANGTQINILASYQVDGVITALAPFEQRNDGWIVGMNQSIAHLSESGEVHERSRPESRNAPEVRTNDGAADPWGRFWLGSMANDFAKGRGSLYRYHESSGAETILDNVTVSNGIGWSPDERTMYYVDSGPGTISAFDVTDTGEITSGRVFAQLNAEQEGAPDGLCVDAEGAIWVAVWGGYQVRRYAANGELLARVALSTAQPSSCAIGGANGTTLYITTAREDMSEELLESERDAGRLFCVDVDVAGLPLAPYRPSPRTNDEWMDTESDIGGESACFAHLVCAVCGAVIESEPHVHRPGSYLDQ